jgi:hypothetical protein
MKPRVRYIKTAASCTPVVYIKPACLARYTELQEVHISIAHIPFSVGLGLAGVTTTGSDVGAEECGCMVVMDDEVAM